MVGIILLDFVICATALALFRTAVEIYAKSAMLVKTSTFATQIYAMGNANGKISNQTAALFLNQFSSESDRYYSQILQFSNQIRARGDIYMALGALSSLASFLLTVSLATTGEDDHNIQLALQCIAVALAVTANFGLWKVSRDRFVFHQKIEQSCRIILLDLPTPVENSELDIITEIDGAPVETLSHDEIRARLSTQNGPIAAVIRHGSEKRIITL